MLRRVLTLVLLGSFAMPAAVFAQEEEDGNGDGGEVFVVSSFKCDSNHLGEIDEAWENEGLPIARELVAEGMIQAAGIYYHWWGDDWNVHRWTVATDLQAFLTAYTELNLRMLERFPDGLNFFDVCTDHKDNIYTLGSSTGTEDEDYEDYEEDEEGEG